MAGGGLVPHRPGLVGSKPPTPPGAVRLATVGARPTAVVAQTTTWQEFPGVWLQLPDEVYAVVRSRHLAGADDGAPKWQNVMLSAQGPATRRVQPVAPS
jgi:hypothetical protein